MVINIASFGGRTHMLDTARELEKFGHTVRFYSWVPTKRAMQFGLKRECSFTLFYYALPFLVLFKIFGFKSWIMRSYVRWCDWFMCLYMKPCDVFIGQSPMHIRSIQHAKNKFGAVTILERGTSHVLEFINNLQGSPEFAVKEVQQRNDVNHDLKGYLYPDYISVGAEHVKESFLKHNFAGERIFVNNYGCNLKFFHSTELKDDDVFDIIQVGNWSYRKGADLIVELCKTKGYRFLHVGSLSAPFPAMENMTQVDAVNEWKLVDYYSKAKVFIMPSREEGLAQVQVQALVCGLPLVCSQHSGGRDLRKYIKEGEWIFEMEDYSVASLSKCVDLALTKASTQTGMRSYCDSEKILEASWEGYGKRYNDFLSKVVK